MKRILFLACLCGSLIGLASCKKEDKAEDVVNQITIYGNVIDRTTGKPLYNVLIKEKNNVGGSTVTGNDGNYEYILPLNGKSNGIFTFVASKSLYSEAEYELRLNEDADKGRKIRVDFQLELGVFHIEGKVTDIIGKPLSNVLIKETYRKTGISTYSDDKGNYSLDLFPYSDSSNKYILSASIENYYSDEYTLSFTEKDYGRTSTVNFQLSSSVKPIKYCYIKGNVTAFPGSRYANQPIANVLIEGFKHKDKNTIGTNLIVSTYTDVNGNYTIKQPIDKDYPYYTYKASKSNWHMCEHQINNTWYSTKTLQITEDMENQTFYINWQGYTDGSGTID